jgi:hypothetical protein
VISDHVDRKACKVLRESVGWRARWDRKDPKAIPDRAVKKVSAVK